MRVMARPVLSFGNLEVALPRWCAASRARRSRFTRVVLRLQRPADVATTFQRSPGVSSAAYDGIFCVPMVTTWKMRPGGNAATRTDV